ncbi:hypothetical protein TNCV_4006741 [Trichonephila clavipes]|nr:hypothetical protein TNCV_4006741 [Trichonephila clavipes]
MLDLLAMGILETAPKLCTAGFLFGSTNKCPRTVAVRSTVYEKKAVSDDEFMMLLRHISALLYMIGWIQNTPTDRSDMGVWLYGHHYRQISGPWIFFIWQSQGIGLLSGIDNKNGPSFQVAKMDQVDIELLQRLLSSIIRHVHAFLDMHNGHLLL